MMHHAFVSIRLRFHSHSGCRRRCQGTAVARLLPVSLLPVSLLLVSLCSPAAPAADTAVRTVAVEGTVADRPTPASTSVDTRKPWQERAITSHVSLGRLGAGDGQLDANTLEQLRDAGEILFSARFTTEDGVGRPFATQAILPTKRRRAAQTPFSRTAGLDANACASCHHQPSIGGAGDFAANVFVSEGFSQADFDTTDPQFSNERNTNHLFGAGLIELLAREMTQDLQRLRGEALKQSAASGDVVEQALESKGVDFGSLRAHPDGRVDTRPLDGVDIDLVVRPFGQKGVMTSLRQFTVNALNHHHGMQADERFGARWTGEADHDGDGHESEITAGDVSALVAWQASLPPPGKHSPDNPLWQQAARRGEARFEALGCAHCHRPALPLDSTVFRDPGPYDAAGTLRSGEATSDSGSNKGPGSGRDPESDSRLHVVPDLQYDLGMLAAVAALPKDAEGRVLVPLWGDLKRHTIADTTIAALGNEHLSQRFVERNVFMTGELWGVASTGPYGHRGDMTTLAEIIDAHGGEARAARDAWGVLDAAARDEIIAFLKTLVIDP